MLAIHFAPDLEVNPVTQGWVNHQLERAKDDGYAAAVIVLDTPGGLSTSMRKIYQKELASPIPVLVYVAPDGARAGSAGLWISEAGDVLAMAPQTNIGASTPISGNGQNLDKDLRRKVINDAAASIVALAKSHGRNSSFPERAVREAASISAPDALQQHVIDLIAPSLPALLRKTDGYKTKPKGFVLHLARRTHRQRQPRLLHALAEHAHRSEHPVAAVPRRDRRARLRDLPSGRRSPGRARRGLAPDRALRLLGASGQLGGHPPAPARCRVTRRRRARHEPRRADRRRARLPGGRLDHAVPERACAVPHVQAARDRGRSRARCVMGVRRLQGLAGAAQTRCGRTRSSLPDPWARSATTGSST